MAWVCFVWCVAAPGFSISDQAKRQMATQEALQNDIIDDLSAMTSELKDVVKATRVSTKHVPV